MKYLAITILFSVLPLLAYYGLLPATLALAAGVSLGFMDMDLEG